MERRAACLPAAGMSTTKLDDFVLCFTPQELLVMIDACRRASARSITAVIPYYGYARADRKTQGRESIAAKLTANLITEAGEFNSSFQYIDR